MTPNEDFYFYEPRSGHGLAHDPINAIVGPRPIGWIGTHDGTGRRNLAPYSYFNVLNLSPPVVGFASVGYKDTIRNVERTGEFSWNLVTRPLAERMNATSATVAPEVDEFELAGLTPVPCLRIGAPRVAQSPVHFECRVCEVKRLQTAAGAPLETWLTLGEVVGIHIARALLGEGVYRTTAARPVVRGGSRDEYYEIAPEALFRMARPD